jgi:hypothetical protein
MGYKRVKMRQIFEFYTTRWNYVPQAQKKTIYTCVKKWILCGELAKVIVYQDLIFKIPPHAISKISWDLDVGQILFFSAPLVW